MFYIYDEITNETLQQLAEYLSGDELEIHVNSAGGNIFSALSMYNLLKNKGASIVVDGLCASAATLILCAGEVTASTGSIFMIHNPGVILFDFYTAEELDKLKNSLDLIKESILDIYSTKLKLSRAEISEMMDAETWMTAEDALELGLIDKIDENLGEVEMSAEGKELMNKYKNSVLAAERKRVSELTALKSESLEVNALIDVAIAEGAELSTVQKYIDAVKSAQKNKTMKGETAFSKMLEDNMKSGAEEVNTSTPEEKISQAELIAKYANEMIGGAGNVR